MSREVTISSAHRSRRAPTTMPWSSKRGGPVVIACAGAAAPGGRHRAETILRHRRPDRQFPAPGLDALLSTSMPAGSRWAESGMGAPTRLLAARIWRGETR